MNQKELTNRIKTELKGCRIRPDLSEMQSGHGPFDFDFDPFGSEATCRHGFHTTVTIAIEVIKPELFWTRDVQKLMQHDLPEMGYNVHVERRSCSASNEIIRITKELAHEGL